MPTFTETTSGASDMPENATVMESLAAGPDELRRKIVELTAQLTEVEGNKKSADKDFNDHIKDLKSEIKMTLALLKEQETENG